MKSERADVPEWDVTIAADGRVSFAHPAQARAYLRAKFAGQCIAAQFYAHRTKRSSRQNRGFHACIYPWALERGHEIEHLKQFLLARVFGWVEFTDPETGEVMRLLAEPHTSDLDMGQFCLLIDRSLELAAMDGVVLLAPDEYRRQKEALAKKAAREARKKEAAA